MTRVEFTVLGDPQPQGSKIAGRATSGRGYVRESNRQLEPWRQAIAAAALKAEPHDTIPRYPTVPLRLDATFVFRRPQAHFGTGRNAGVLKPNAPAYRQSMPDVDKLVRAVCDAVTGIVCRDDAQFVIIHAEKHYGDHACAHIAIEELQ